jgi:hypothetical protein
MTSKDKNILLGAMKLRSTEHQKIERFIEMADSEETKQTLRSIERNLYHTEEYIAGTL